MDFWDDYDAVMDGIDGWQAILAAWDVDLVVVPAKSEAFATRMAAAGWRSVYEDTDGTVFAPPGS